MPTPTPDEIVHITAAPDPQHVGLVGLHVRPLGEPFAGCTEGQSVVTCVPDRVRQAIRVDAVEPASPEQVAAYQAWWESFATPVPGLTPGARVRITEPGERWDGAEGLVECIVDVGPCSYMVKLDPGDGTHMWVGFSPGQLQAV